MSLASAMRPGVVTSAPGAVRPALGLRSAPGVRVSVRGPTSVVRRVPSVHVEPTPSPVAVKAASGVPAVVNTAAADEPPSEFQWGAKMDKLAISVGVGALLWFLPFRPEALSPQAWHLFSIFVGTIIGIITQPVPLGAVAMLGLGAAMMTKTLTFAQGFAAFASEIPWLIAIAFWLSDGFIKSGLGNRVAYSIVSVMGKTTLGLTYALVFAEALLAPCIPSVAARAGGIFFPLSLSLCKACGSDPENGTEKKLGAYIMKTCFQTTTISSGMFITAMAANPLAVNLAAEAIGQTISWGQWAIAGIVPGLICLVSTPLILYALYPPEVKDTPDAPVLAKEELKKLGPLSTDEKITAGAFALTVALWILGPSIGINNVAAALTGWAILLITGVTSWKAALNKNAAWDTLTWFAALIAMAGALQKLGFIPWFSQQVVNLISSMGMGWQGSLTVVTLLYFYSHYLFASGAAHIGAMYTAFLSVAVGCGAPPVPTAILLGQLSNLMGCLTTYGIGSAPPYFASGYVAQDKWYVLGFILSVFYLAVWLLGGSVWWKAIGLL